MVLNNDNIKKGSPELNINVNKLLPSVNNTSSDEDDKKKKPSFNKKAYKHAIGMIESSGGKYLETGINPNTGRNYSSAAGKYHFLYNSIKDDPSMKGVSKREFMNRPDLQELIMDKALDGTLENYTYGRGYAQKLKSQFKTNHDLNDITALIHFLGAGNVRKYLRDPENFRVPGAKNATAQQYVDRFRKHFDSFADAESPSPQPTTQPMTKPLVKDERNIETAKDATYVAPKRIMQSPTMEKGIRKINLRNSTSIPEESELQFLTEMTSENTFKDGGHVTGLDGADELVTLFENGGSHEVNPNGGIPQGVGSNGKVNLVEEGETKWNDYIFSNSIGLDGSYTADGKTSNVFEVGGDLTDPNKNKNKTSESKENNDSTPRLLPEAMEGPVAPEGSKYPLKFTKTKTKFHKKGRDIYVDDIRGKYTGKPVPYANTGNEDDVDFSSAVTDDNSLAFLNRYDNTWAREKMKEQTGLSDYDIDNMILRGLEAEKEIGGNKPESKASYDHLKHKINIGEKHSDDSNVEAHERVHASGFDAAQGKNLVELLGSSFQQEGKGWLKKFDPNILRYLNQPHEAYGNFVEFREKIGLKPGEKIDVDELKKRVKKTGAGMENFYRAFSDENIVNALNTIAYQGDNKQSEYKLA